MKTDRIEGVQRPLTVSEAASLAHCAEAAIRRAIAVGEIRRLPIGRTVRIPRASFIRWLQEGSARDGEMRRA